MMDITIKKPAGKYKILLIFLLLSAVVLSACFAAYKITDNTRVHYAADFGFDDLTSPYDADGDGTDDFTDMVEGARAYIATDPEYVSGYYAGGYPDEGEGVCTDVIWHAFEAAGYCLKDMVDADIKANKELYPDHADSNIDFRRVRNLLVFFQRHAEELTVSFTDPEDWMPGDIVIFDGHIAICSDKRNSQGIPYLIHHGNNVTRAHEGNDMKYMGIVAHFRYYPETVN